MRGAEHVHAADALERRARQMVGVRLHATSMNSNAREGAQMFLWVGALFSAALLGFGIGLPLRALREDPEELRLSCVFGVTLWVLFSPLALACALSERRLRFATRIRFVVLGPAVATLWIAVAITQLPRVFRALIPFIRAA